MPGINAPALAKNLSAYIRRMFKGSDVTVGLPYKAAQIGVFKNHPVSWNFKIERSGTRSGETILTVVYVRQTMPGSAAGLDVLVDGRDAELVRNMIAEMPPPWW